MQEHTATTTDAPPPTRASSPVHTGALPHPLTSHGGFLFFCLSFLPEVLVCKGFPSPFTKAEQMGKNRRFSIFSGLPPCYSPTEEACIFFSSAPDSQNWKIGRASREHRVQLLSFATKEMETKKVKWHTQGCRARWKLVSSREDIQGLAPLFSASKDCQMSPGGLPAR